MPEGFGGAVLTIRHWAPRLSCDAPQPSSRLLTRRPGSWWRLCREPRSLLQRPLLPFVLLSFCI